MFSTYTKKVFKFTGDFILFFILVALVLATSFPMQFYAYEISKIFDKRIWIVIYGLMVVGIWFFVERIDANRIKTSGEWLEERKPIDRRWIFMFIIFEIVMWAYVILEGILAEHLGLGEALNQAAIENELMNFPIKPWLYLHMILVAPILEELVFRKAFMDLFFKKNSFICNIFAIFLSGMIFGFLHERRLSWYFVFYSMSGVILGFVYRYSRDIRLPMGVHVVNNLVSVLLSIFI